MFFCAGDSKIDETESGKSPGIGLTAFINAP